MQNLQPRYLVRRDRTMSLLVRAARQQIPQRARGMAVKPEIKAWQEKMCSQNYNASHGKDLPTYMKGDTDKPINAFMVGLFGVGTILSARGFYNMSYGINKA